VEKLNTNRYALLLFPRGAKEKSPSNALIVSFSEQLEENIKENYHQLFYPNPVKVSKSFWNELKQAKNGKKRIKVFKKFGILTEKNIYQIERVVLDIDSPFSSSYPVWEKLKKKYRSLSGDVYITKSGNLRVVIELEFPLHPKLASKVKKTVRKLGKFFQENGLKFDPTCVSLNHPIWIDRGEELVVEGKKVNFLSLYEELFPERENISPTNSEKSGSSKRHLPPLQKSENGRNSKRKAGNSDKIQHSCLAWKIFANSLRKKYSENRFQKVILPTVGTAKVLGIDWKTVENTLNSLLKDRNKKKNQKDFKIAKRYCRKAEYLPFPDKEQLANKVVSKIARNGFVTRQEVVKLCFNQVWLAEEVIEKLFSLQLIRLEKKKLKPGRGRKAHVYFFSISDSEYKKITSHLTTTTQKLLKTVKDIAGTPVKNYSPAKRFFSSEKNLINGGSLLQEAEEEKKKKQRSKKKVVTTSYYKFQSSLQGCRNCNSQVAGSSKRISNNVKPSGSSKLNEIVIERKKKLKRTAEFLEKAVKLQEVGDFVKFGKLFEKSLVVEVKLFELNKLYFSGDKENAKLVGKVTSLSVVKENPVSGTFLCRLPNDVFEEIRESYPQVFNCRERKTGEGSS